MTWRLPGGGSRANPGKLAKAARQSARRRTCPACARGSALAAEYGGRKLITLRDGREVQIYDPDVFTGWTCRWCGWTGTTAERNAAQLAAGMRGPNPPRIDR